MLTAGLSYELSGYTASAGAPFFPSGFGCACDEVLSKHKNLELEAEPLLDLSPTTVTRGRGTAIPGTEVTSFCCISITFERIAFGTYPLVVDALDIT